MQFVDGFHSRGVMRPCRSQVAVDALWREFDGHSSENVQNIKQANENEFGDVVVVIDGKMSPAHPEAQKPKRSLNEKFTVGTMRCALKCDEVSDSCAMSRRADG